MSVQSNSIERHIDDDNDSDDSSVGASVLDGTESSDSLFVSDGSNSPDDAEYLGLPGGGGIPDVDESHEEVLQQRDNYKIAFERAKNARTYWMRKARRLEQQKRNVLIEVDKLKHGRRAPEPWPTILRAWIRGDRPNLSWIDIYRECCGQENMSKVIGVTHPDLTIIRKTLKPSKLRWYNSPARGRYHGPWRGLDFVENENLLSIILPYRTPPPLLGLLEPAPFPFERLPHKAQVRIFRHILVKKQVIHCISRLDPGNPSVDFPPEGARRRNLLLHRFHFSKEPCLISKARQPREILAPLLVSKRWYFIGVHVFYGANTFAFSSLGELGTFMRGIGQARAERIANVELMWHGNQMPRASRLNQRSPLPVETCKVSQRTSPLAWFMKTKRLRTLVVHISESGKRRMKRKYEMRAGGHYSQDYANEDEFNEERLDVFQKMVRRTDLHPNYRKNRSMRTTHGIDYLYQLRGMKWIRFYEVDSERNPIRDWSFMIDLTSVVTLPKPQRLFWQSELENLTRLARLGDWQPDEDDFGIIHRFYDETHTGDEFLGGSDTTLSERGTTPTDGTQSTLSDNNDGDDGGDGNGHVPTNSTSVQDMSESDMGSPNADDNMEIGSNSGDQDMPDANSIASSRSSQLSSSPSSGWDDNQGGPPISTQQTTIPSQMNPIDLTTEDDSDNDHEGEPDNDVDKASSSDDLFVPWRLGSILTTTDRSSDELFVPWGSASVDSTTRGHRTEVPDTSLVIDLTMTDAESEDDDADIKSESESKPDTDDMVEEEEEYHRRGSLKHPTDLDSENESDSPDLKRPRVTESDPGLENDSSTDDGGSDVPGPRAWSI